jgi:carboxypeptidase T
MKRINVGFILFIIINILISSNPLFQESNVSKAAATLSMDRYEYHTYQEMTDQLLNLSKNNSDIMLVSSIGKTYEGRDIWLVTLSDNVELDEQESEVLLMGAHHGNEKPSFEVLIYFINYIVNKYNKEPYDDDQDSIVNEDPYDGLDNDQDGLIDEDPPEEQVTNTIDNTKLFIIPMVNPDGVASDWRKNRAPNYGADGTEDHITSYGVDLNRNYGYKWKIPYLFPENYYLDYLLDDVSWTYRGEEPFCENETKAIKSLVEKNNISISLSYHDYGEWMIFPWMHTSRRAPHETLFRALGESISQINGYELKIYGQYGEREYLFPRFCGTPGSSENWLYGEHDIIAYTIELCRRRTEYNVDKVIDTCWKHVGVNLLVCERSWTIEEEKKVTYHNSFYDIMNDNIENFLISIYDK